MENLAVIDWNSLLEFFCHSERSRGISGQIFASESIERCLDSARHDNRLFFAVEITGLLTLDNDAICGG
jgi:hypothetical protein